MFCEAVKNETDVTKNQTVKVFAQENDFQHSVFDEQYSGILMRRIRKVLSYTASNRMS